jgi:uncharacterized membrane protein
MTDERMDRMIGILLRIGVIASAVVTLAGGIWHFALQDSVLPDYRIFRPTHTPIGLSRPENLIQLGLIMLIATPIARVALSVVAFALEKDRLYVAITLIVLACLIASLFGVLT